MWAKIGKWTLILHKDQSPIVIEPNKPILISYGVIDPSVVSGTNSNCYHQLPTWDITQDI